MRRSWNLCGAALILAASTALAAPAQKWIHVHVDDGDEKVRITVPLSLVESVLPLIQADELRNGKVRIDDRDLHGIDLRALWKAVREAPEGEFVTVEGGGGNVRVAASKGFMVVEALEGAAKQNVRVRLPMPVVDALFQRGADELDVLGAVRALAAHPGGDLVTVDEGAKRVRIWVDSGSAAR